MPAPPCGDYGDVNDDGNVSGADLMMAQQHLAGTRTLTADQLKRAIVKGYGDEVTREDVYLISQYAVGEIYTFPVCGESPEHLVTVTIPRRSIVKIDGAEVI